MKTEPNDSAFSAPAEAKPEISELGIRTANSIMAFIQHPPSSNYMDEVRDSIARSIDFACKKNKVGYVRLTKLNNAAPELLELAEQVLSFLVHDDRGKSPLADNCRKAIKKAT